MTFEFMYDISIWKIFTCSLIIFLVISEISYRRGAHLKKHKDEAVSQLISSSILGLLALLLGFTLSMSISRYEARKSLVVKEANAIGTAYARTKSFSGPVAEKQMALFKNYIDHRLHYFERFSKKDSIGAYKAEANHMLDEIWNNGLALTKNNKSSISSTYLSALNSVMDVHSERVFASENHVPEVVYFVISLTALLGISMISHVSGFKKQRHISNYLLMILFLIVIALIQDLDRPGRGWVRVDQKSLIDLKESL